MKKIFTTLIFLSISLALFSQMQDFRLIPNGNAPMGAIVVFGNLNNGKPIPYDKINGTPFWKEEWQTANIYAPDGYYYGKYMAKINLSNNEVHYLNKKGAELAGTASEIGKVLFFDVKDTNKVEAIFQSNLPNTADLCQVNGKSCFFQLISPGSVFLLKKVRKEVQSVDSMVIYKSFHFVDKKEYFIYAAGKINRIKSLSRDNILSLVPSSKDYEAWIKQNNIRFNKEGDVMKFLDYYNANLPTVSN